VIVKITSKKHACPKCHSGFIVVDDSDEDGGVCINCGYREPGSGNSLERLAQSFAGWRLQKHGVPPAAETRLKTDPIGEVGLEVTARD